MTWAVAGSLDTVRLVNRSRAEAFWTCCSSDTHKEKVNSFGFVVMLSLGEEGHTSKESLSCLKTVLTGSLASFISKVGVDFHSCRGRGKEG